MPSLDGDDGPRSPAGGRDRTRGRDGRIAVILFFVLFALTQPPFSHTLANRIEPWVLGFPFFFAYLLALYAGMIAVLVWARRRGL